MTGQDADRFPAGSDARWRAEYRQRQHDEGIEAVQPDLFGAPAIEHHRRHPIARAKVKRASRPTPRPALTDQEKAAQLASASNWLRTRQRVRIIDSSTHRFAGRAGVVWRLCSPVFADHVYVNLDLAGTERTEKIAFIEVYDVEPIEECPAPSTLSLVWRRSAPSPPARATYTSPIGSGKRRAM